MKKVIERLQLKRVLQMKYTKWTLMIFGLVIIIGVSGYGVILYGGGLVVDEEDFIMNMTTTIETADGKVIKELYEENRKPIHIESLPSHVKEAFVAIEDRRFYHHAGVDFKAISRAIIRDIRSGGKAEGASTITQQVAKNLFLNNDKTWMRKTKEAMASVYLERHFTKDEILNLYLNVVYFGEGAYGIEQAAHTYFSKSASELTIHEAALLAGLVKSPTIYSPVENPEASLHRRNIVIKVMEEAKFITAKEKLQETRKPLGLNRKNTENKPYLDSYVDLVMREAAKKHELSLEELKRGGYRIVVNLDEDIQKVAYDYIQKDEYFRGNTAGVQSAFVLLEGKSSQILAAIGGRNYQLGNLNRVIVKKQPGSTMKPIAVFGPALMKDSYNPYSLLVDEKKRYGEYTATNYDDRYDGVVTIYDSIVHSKNASTVWLLNEIGIPYSKKYLEKLDIELEDEGLALALGGLKEGLTPLQLANSYRPFLVDGAFQESATIERIYDSDDSLIYKANRNKESVQVFSPQVAADMTEMLKQTVQTGTAKAGTYEKALAGKTGTTQHPLAVGKTKDAWFAGYTPEYVFATWIGYDDSSKEHYLNGDSRYPTMLTKDILNEIDKEKDLQKEFTLQKGLIKLEEPIRLPLISNINGDYIFGGLSLVKGELTWETTTDDKRVEYRIYLVQDGIDKRIGSVTGEHSFVIDNVDLFKTNYYYIVPYNRLTKLEGERSELIELAISF